MKRPLHNPIILTTALLLIYKCVSIAGQFKVVRVYDGDTVKAVGHDIEIKVRLVGIDAPETKKGKRKPGLPYSQKATKFLAKLVLNKTIEVKGHGVDRYNRIFGVVFINDTNVNLEMVRAGLAEFYRGRPPMFFVQRRCSGESGRNHPCIRIGKTHSVTLYDGVSGRI